MAKINSFKRAVLAALLVTPMLILGPTQISKAQAYETNSAGYEVPDLTGYKKLGQVWKDIDEDGTKETLFMVYQNSADNFITQYNSNGHVWAWGVIKDRKAGDGYAIVDSDCDSVYDQKYIGDDAFVFPACLR